MDHPWTIGSNSIYFPANSWELLPHHLEQFRSQLKEEWQLALYTTLSDWFLERKISTRTSGSTGAPKDFTFSMDKVERSAFRTLKHLGIERGATMYSPLPCGFIGGKMMVIRALLNASPILVEKPSLNPRLFNSNEHQFAAFTPSMWGQIIQHQPASDTKVILGGEAVNEQLELDSAAWPKVYSTYGMTETISHIALRQLNEATEYTLLEGVGIRIGAKGNLIIEDGGTQWETNDLVHMNSSNTFSVLGRLDNIINSGGKKLVPELLEAELPEQYKGAAISWKPDATWGMKAVLVLLENHPLPPSKNIFSGDLLYIKQWMSIREIPRTKNGKIDRKVLQQIVETADCKDLK